MSQRSCRAKMPVRSASRLYCATKCDFRMSTDGGLPERPQPRVAHAENSCATRGSIAPLVYPQLFATKEMTSRPTVGLETGEAIVERERHQPQGLFLTRRPRLVAGQHR